jgi:drug/metabolite transporter (DMT)-like permease
MFLVLFLYAISAVSFFVVKQGLQYAKPFFSIGFRFCFVGLLLLAFQLIRNRKKLSIKRKDTWTFINVMLFNVYFVFIPLSWGLQYVSAFKAIFLFSFTPFIVAIFAYFLASERFSVYKISGMLISFIGMIPILMTQDDMREAAMELCSISLPEAAVLVSVVASSYAWFPIKRLLSKGYPAPLIHGTTMLGGGILALGTSFYIEGIKYLPVNDFGNFLICVSIVAFSSNIIFYGLYSYLLFRYSFTFLSFAQFICPICGSLLSWAVFGKIITWHYGVALFFFSIGMMLFYRDKNGVFVQSREETR